MPGTAHLMLNPGINYIKSLRIELKFGNLIKAWQTPGFYFSIFTKLKILTMKLILVFVLLAASCACFAQKQVDFQTLNQLTGGSWYMKTARGITGEIWKKINNDELHNQAFKIIGKDTTLLEKVQLIKKGNDIYYISIVQNQNDAKPISFKLMDNSNNQFVFSNPAHDFPQRIVYHFVTKDSIHAWIDGQYNGKFVKQDFYYKRVK
jgi:hypothetical protein